MSSPRPYVLPHLRRFRLLDLPTEIRLLILEILLFGESVTNVPVCFRPQDLENWNSAIFRVNGQLYHEASAVLSGGVNVPLDLHDDYYSRPCTDAFRSGSALKWLPIDLKTFRRWPRLRFLRHFRLNIWCFDKIHHPHVHPDRFFELCAEVADTLRDCHHIESLTLSTYCNLCTQLPVLTAPLLRLPATRKALCFPFCPAGPCRNNQGLDSPEPSWCDHFCGHGMPISDKTLRLWAPALELGFKIH